MQKYEIGNTEDEMKYLLLSFFDYEAESKEELLHSLSEVVRKEGMVRDGFEEGVIEREKDFPTGLALERFNIAIPHTYAKYVAHPGVVAARLKKPVVFTHMATEDQPVEVNYVFMLLIQDGDKQVYLLQNLMEMCQTKECVDALEAADSPEKIAAVLKPFIEKSMRGGE